MNAKLLLKLVFTIIVLFLLVLMGMSNKQTVTFALAPIWPRGVQEPAAIMYLAFFALGLLSGVILTAGGGKKSAGGAAKSSSSK
jgi:uncharacterized integral membrane protein